LSTDNIASTTKFLNTGAILPRHGLKSRADFGQTSSGFKCVTVVNPQRDQLFVPSCPKFFTPGVSCILLLHTGIAV